MRYFLRCSRALLTTWAAFMFQYRAELYLWVLATILPLIMLGLWEQAGRSGQFALTGPQFVSYFLAVFIVRQLTVVWVIWEFEGEVVSGKLSSRLLQPIDPAWHHIASHLAERAPRLPFVLLLTAAAAWVWIDELSAPPWQGVLLGMVHCGLVFALRFAIQYTFAMLAFWTERAAAIEDFAFLFYLFLGGLLAPLEVFPAPLAAAVLYTPFPYLAYVPAALMTGQISEGGEVLLAFLVPICWLLGLFLLNRWLWRRGLRRYASMGG